MKEIRVAGSAGFCFGVKRAVELVEKAIGEGQGPIYTYGPLIHNEEVVRSLEERGVRAVETLEELSSLPPGTMVLRSHGVSREEEERIRSAGFAVVDATCPFVSKIHRLVERASREGRDVVLVGDAGHPEVEGIRGWGDPSRVTVIGSAEEAKAYRSLSGKVLAVSQTTQNPRKFKEIVEIIRETEYNAKGYDVEMVDTVCSATEERQKETAEMADRMDAMIVIGGSQSSNTRKLVDICRSACKRTFFIQTVRDLDILALRDCNRIGITAGASTPTNIIEEVQTRVRNEF